MEKPAEEILNNKIEQSQSFERYYRKDVLSAMEEYAQAEKLRLIKIATQYMSTESAEVFLKVVNSKPCPSSNHSRQEEI